MDIYDVATIIFYLMIPIILMADIMIFYIMLDYILDIVNRIKIHFKK